VTGQGNDGSSRVISIGSPPTVFLNPKSPGGGRVADGDAVPETLEDGELLVAELWETSDSPPTASDVDPTVGMRWSSGAERPGATRWRVVRHGPNRVAGLHKTGTIDYDVLIDGQLNLVLSSEEVRLEPGDCVVIPNVEHGWHAGPEGATLIVVAVGV
jgi:hypothetical protein